MKPTKLYRYKNLDHTTWFTKFYYTKEDYENDRNGVIIYPELISIDSLTSIDPNGTRLELVGFSNEFYEKSRHFYRVKYKPVHFNDIRIDPQMQLYIGKMSDIKTCPKLNIDWTHFYTGKDILVDNYDV